MNRKLGSYWLPHLLFLSIVAMYVCTIIFRGSSLAISSIVLFIAICLIIFASKIALWGNELINQQRMILADRFGADSILVSVMLCVWGTRFTNAWAFRTYGFALAILSAYHLYNQYLIATIGYVIDNKTATDIMLNILMLFFLIQLWLTRPYKKIIVGLSVSWLLLVITFVLSASFDLIALAPITFLAFIACGFFIVRGILAERNFKKQ
ncbi:MAG: hypothetical protein JSW16_05705 [Dehalococcoidales bacterium]|nr:MAG: hypothetical protein JSW16_05705 [Dehalococcoidales bacterium]